MTADWLLLGVEAEKNRSVAFTGHQDYDGRADAGQPESFSDADKRRYADVLTAADRTVVLADSYSRGCYYRRNDYLVDHAVRVVAWYIRRNSGTGYTVRRARHQGVEVLNLYEDKMNPTLF